MKWQERKDNDEDGTDERNNEVPVKRTGSGRDETGEDSEH